MVSMLRNNSVDIFLLVLHSMHQVDLGVMSLVCAELEEGKWNRFSVPYIKERTSR